VHWTQERSLPVSKRTVRLRRGVPMPMVTTYSWLWKGRPRRAGARICGGEAAMDGPDPVAVTAYDGVVVVRHRHMVVCWPTLHAR
jgi:hypothetical protein